jgi:hypothetical protein
MPSDEARSSEELLERIRRQNLDVYRASPIRITEDINQEQQVTTDYRGRLAYELLQNADDAMVTSAGIRDRILFRLTDTELLVANNGRPLDERDVEGLCGLGASFKSVATGPRRASIGHKGMGFKSVLEITDTPIVVSSPYRFRMDPDRARADITANLNGGVLSSKYVPVMRFPWPQVEEHPAWAALQDRGYTVLFAFPLRPSLGSERRKLLADLLLGMPTTAILFLKHLEEVDVDVVTSERSGQFSWRLARERRSNGTWEPSPGLTETGVYQVQITKTDGELEPNTSSFVVAHNADLPIGGHRVGLLGFAWEGVEYSEVSVAAPMSEHSADDSMTPTQFHVFLPTGEDAPYPLLVNGAFATDLSRQEIRVGADTEDYNRYLIGQAATLCRERLIPALLETGSEPIDILRLLDRGTVLPPDHAASAGALLHAEMRRVLADLPLIPTETGAVISIANCVVPASVGAEGIGSLMRSILPSEATIAGWRFPSASYCGGLAARVLADLGAHALSPLEAITALATVDPVRSALRPLDESKELFEDPVLTTLEGLWASMPDAGRASFCASVRAAPLFPVGATAERIVTRVATQGVTCFYPPRSLTRDVPLSGLRFLLQQVCWGRLIPRERNERLAEQMTAWRGLFDIREFKFPDVMRAGVLPALELDPPPAGLEARRDLQQIDTLAAICQLSGRTPNSTAPLPYERLGSNRQLFNLSRLPLPCRGTSDTEVRWVPAYQVYFGEDWIGDASVERLFAAAHAVGRDDLPDVPLLVAPTRFQGFLALYAALGRAVADEEAEADEVGLDEDEEAPLETEERARWIEFLTWLGVNHSLRLIHFHDVEDRGRGWLSTGGFKKPSGWAFQAIGPTWNRWTSHARVAEKQRADTTGTWYFTEVRDLDHCAFLAPISKADTTNTVATALFLHLARNWHHLSRFQRAHAAMVPAGLTPGMRSPVRPYPDEDRDLGDDLWLYRLRRMVIVPTTHGPRTAARAWLPSDELARRFGRRGSRAGDLIPILSLGSERINERARAFATALRVREDFNPTTFLNRDAEALLKSIADRFRRKVETGTLVESELRQIRPAYRNLFELLAARSSVDEDDEVGEPSQADSLQPAADPILAACEVLARDGTGGFRFVPATEVVYVARAGTRERLESTGTLWTFVLEASVTARRAIRLLGMRVLEEELEWEPTYVDLPLDEQEQTQFSEGLNALRPYILARMYADRPDERLASRDRARLDRLIRSLIPVQSLQVTGRLDGRVVAAGVDRDAFVDIRRDGTVRAFVRWGDEGWREPLLEPEATALAAALVETFGAGAFEAFVALIRADTNSRTRLLQRAGAPPDLGQFSGTEPDPQEREGQDLVPEEGMQHTVELDGEEAGDGAIGGPPTSRQQGDLVRAPLYRPSQLVIGGVPVIVTGAVPGAGGGNGGPGQSAEQSSSAAGAGSHDGAFGGRTDLTELDCLGMYVALTFERNRLRHGGANDAVSSLEVEVSSANAMVFDVSTKSAIARAWELFPAFKVAYGRLLDLGVNQWAPGFDILTLDPEDVGRAQRLIELKSSGINARTQSMTWNEWKAAQANDLRDHFYLYLVGNLRTDLASGEPFLRVIHDPFGSLWAQSGQREVVQRTIQLNVTEFAEAEELALKVRSGDSDSSLEVGGR